MTSKTEGQHKGEFLLSEAPGTLSREVGTLLSGETVSDGRVVAKDGNGKVYPANGTVDSNGDSDEDIVGISYGDYDASTAEVEMVYVARLAEVRDVDVTRHEAGSESEDESDAAIEAALEALNIRLR